MVLCLKTSLVDLGHLPAVGEGIANFLLGDTPRSLARRFLIAEAKDVDCTAGTDHLRQTRNVERAAPRRGTCEKVPSQSLRQTCDPTRRASRRYRPENGHSAPAPWPWRRRARWRRVRSRAPRPHVRARRETWRSRRCHNRRRAPIPESYPPLPDRRRQAGDRECPRAPCPGRPSRIALVPWLAPFSSG